MGAVETCHYVTLRESAIATYRLPRERARNLSGEQQMTAFYIGQHEIDDQAAFRAAFFKVRTSTVVHARRFDFLAI